jgi:hypothetical protein
MLQARPLTQSAVDLQALQPRVGGWSFRVCVSK